MGLLSMNNVDDDQSIYLLCWYEVVSDECIQLLGPLRYCHPATRCILNVRWPCCVGSRHRSTPSSGFWRSLQQRSREACIVQRLGGRVG